MEKFYIYRNNKKNIILVFIFFLATIFALVNAFQDQKQLNIFTFIQPVLFFVLLFVVLKRRNYFVSISEDKVVLNIPKHKNRILLKVDIRKIEVELFSINIKTKSAEMYSIDLNETSKKTVEQLKQLFKKY
jgi:hypothetical protein